MSNLILDLRYGLRLLLRKPGFTLVAIAALALALGVSAAVLGAVNAFLLRPTNAADPDRLVTVFTGSEKDARVYDAHSYPNYVDLRDGNTTLSGLAARSMSSLALGSNASNGERSEVIWGELVSGNYFDVVGIAPAIGREFTSEEGWTPNAHQVVILSHRVWQRRFNGDPAIIGSAVQLNGRPFTVIGVMPASFKGMKFPLAMDFWVPLAVTSRLYNDPNWMTNRGRDYLYLFGRLKPGATPAQAEADLNRVGRQLCETYPEINGGTKIQVVPEHEGRTDEVFAVIRLGALMAIAVLSLVVAVACANVANLLLARGAARRREIAIRLALGAGRGRIIRQLLLESLMLATLGGAAGLLVAFWGADLLQASLPPMPYIPALDFAPDARVLLWTLALTVLTGVIFGLAPALHAAHTDLIPALKSEAGAVPSASPAGRLAGRPSLRQLLVMAQVAISVVVVICAGLLLRSLYNVQTADPGFRTENLVSMTLDPELLGYSDDEGRRLYAELERRVRALPGVESASVATLLPLSDSSYTTGPLMIEGQEPPPPNQGLFVGYSSIGTRYFETSGTPLVAGRDFTERDHGEAPAVVIINEELARRLYGGTSAALGRHFRLGRATTPPLEIVGVARDGRYRGLFENPRPYMFLPLAQRFYRSQAMLLARAIAEAETERVMAGMRRELVQADSRLPVFDLKIGKQHLSYAYWAPRLGAGMAATLGLLALVLATTGIYSVMTYAVSQRTREIGLRLALGAQPRDVLRMVVREGLALSSAGVAIGLLGAFALARALAGLLLGVRSFDPPTFIAVALILTLVALAACYVPARRAARTDPMIALRNE